MTPLQGAVAATLGTGGALAEAEAGHVERAVQIRMALAVA
jgi:hypothetical protein